MPGAWSGRVVVSDRACGAALPDGNALVRRAYGGRDAADRARVVPVPFESGDRQSNPASTDELRCAVSGAVCTGAGSLAISPPPTRVRLFPSGRSGGGDLRA